MRKRNAEPVAAAPAGVPAASFFQQAQDSPGLQWLSNKTGMPAQYVLWGGMILAGLILCGFGMGPLSAIIGFIYPMFKSFHAIEASGLGVAASGAPMGAAEQRQLVVMLKYWVVYTFFTLCEFFGDALLFWVPFYPHLKLGFLLWCLRPFEMLGGRTGGELMYERFFGKALHENRDQLEEFGAKVQHEVSNVVDRLGADVKTQGRKHANSIAAGATSAVSAGLSAAHEYASSASIEELDDAAPPNTGAAGAGKATETAAGNAAAKSPKGKSPKGGLKSSVAKRVSKFETKKKA